LPHREWDIRIDDMIAAVEDVVAASPQIPWARMRGMRNLAVHEYFGIDVNVLWDTVTVNLPSLPPLLRELPQD
jgi:uncharacterized protein with HEPN domain